jgi:CheY-like chemotaxis protein
VRQVVSLQLAQLGLEAISFDNAREIVALACRYRPVLIVLDLMLPITDGYTAIRELRRDPETTPIPIVVISGDPRGLALVRAQTRDAGPLVLLRKPFTLAELRNAVRQVLDPGSDTQSDQAGSP